MAQTPPDRWPSAHPQRVSASRSSGAGRERESRSWSLQRQGGESSVFANQNAMVSVAAVVLRVDRSKTKVAQSNWSSESLSALVRSARRLSCHQRQEMRERPRDSDCRPLPPQQPGGKARIRTGVRSIKTTIRSFASLSIHGSTRKAIRRAAVGALHADHAERRRIGGPDVIEQGTGRAPKAERKSETSGDHLGGRVRISPINSQTRELSGEAASGWRRQSWSGLWTEQLMVPRVQEGGAAGCRAPALERSWPAASPQVKPVVAA